MIMPAHQIADLAKEPRATEQWLFRRVAFSNRPVLGGEHRRRVKWATSDFRYV